MPLASSLVPGRDARSRLLDGDMGDIARKQSPVWGPRSSSEAEEWRGPTPVALHLHALAIEQRLSVSVSGDLPNAPAT
jgi:hypothetical protein